MYSKISIIVPCFNRENHIKECAKSILSQSYPMEFMEIIFVDDASTDNTLSILKELESNYPENILIVELQQNTGCAGNVRNIGLSYATGDYVLFVDSDDRINPHTLETLNGLACKYNADIVSGNKEMFSEGTIIMTETKSNRTFDTSNPQDFVDLLAAEGNDGHIGAKLYKRSFIESNNIRFPENRHVSEDTFFSMNCLLHLHIFCQTSEVLYHYRLNPNGLWRSNNQPPEQILECIQTQEDLYPLYIQKLSGIPEVMEWFFFQALSNVKCRLISMGQVDYYQQILPDIRVKFNSMVPNLKNNPILFSQMNDENTHELYDDLFLRNNAL